MPAAGDPVYEGGWGTAGYWMRRSEAARNAAAAEAAAAGAAPLDGKVSKLGRGGCYYPKQPKQLPAPPAVRPPVQRLLPWDEAESLPQQLQTAQLAAAPGEHCLLVAAVGSWPHLALGGNTTVDATCICS